ncbi:MAG: nitroreductase family protein [Candidatus Jordarchaeaceae archaeon]
MDVFEAINKRRSTRRYKSENVSDEQVKKLLEAAIMAPSGGNMQPWDFIVVRDEQQKKALARAALGQMFIATAPVVIVVCANKPRTARRYGDRGVTLYSIQDTAAATENILLAATAMGLAGCWVGAFDDDAVSKVLGLPNYVRPVVILPIGVPDEFPRMPPRIPLNDVTHYDKW